MGADSELLEVEIERSGDGVAVVALAGELDLSTIPRLEPRLFAELSSRGAVVVDLTGLSFIDSSGIGLLIKAHQAADGGVAVHTVIAPGSQVDRVLGLAGIDRALPLFTSRGDAMAAAIDR